MQRFHSILVPFAIVMTHGVEASRAPFVHVQSDRPSYRLGETVWFRVHSLSEKPVLVTLLDPDGQEVDKSILRARGNRPASGSFLLSELLPGGIFKLVAKVEDRVAHEALLEVYDLTLPELDMDLTVLGDAHYPGQPVVASFRAVDFSGRPVQGARVHYLANFGQIRVREGAGVTDAEGRALIRFSLPDSVEHSGYLAVGLSCPAGEAAIARRVEVSTSVARVDAFPEGGTIVEGHPQRLGLLVRDLHGQPTAAEGRVLDDEGRSVVAFRADDRGLATVVIPYAPGRTYEAVIDRPARVRRRFPLPGPTGHRYAVFVEPAKEGFLVEVRGSKETAGRTPTVVITSGKGSATRKGVHLTVATRAKQTRKLPTRGVTFRHPGARGVGHILLIDGGRVLLKRPVFLGARSGVQVTLEPKGDGPLLPGKRVAFEVSTTRDGRPVSADLGISLFQGESSGMPDLVARSIVEPQLATGIAVPADFLADGEDADDRRDAFLLVYGAYAYPADGLALGDAELPAADVGRCLPASISSGQEATDEEPPRAARRSSGRTIVRAVGLERLLERAHFTRSARSRSQAHSVRLLARPRTLLATPGLGRKSRVLPQKMRVPSSRVDSRRTLFWSDRVRTDRKGRASIRLRLNHVVAGLTWVAQGHAAGTPASARGTISPDAGFQASFGSPSHLHVGDVFDLMLTPKVSDGSQEPVRIEFHVPSCLKPLLRTRLSYDPRLDKRLHRFRFEAVAPAERAEIRLVARRGIYQEEHVRRLQVVHREVELTNGESGRDHGSKHFLMKIPRDAVPGSVRLHASVSPGSLAQALEWLRGLLRIPTGCFEQFTSQNLVNLVVLDAMLKHGEDPKLLGQAYRLARQGFERLLTHRDPKSGGFSLWSGENPSVRCSVVAVRHLALYDKIFDGLGRPELETALTWLEGHREISRLEGLYLTLSLHEIGRTWKGSSKIGHIETGSPYEMALKAACLASWPDDPDGPDAEGVDSASRRAARQQQAKRLLDTLEQKLATQETFADNGVGIMGSSGGQLSVETLALIAMALEASGRPQDGETVLAEISDRQGIYGGTQGTALAIQAFTRLAPPLASERLDVEFEAHPGGRKKMFTLPNSARPLSFERHVPLKPGSTASISVRINSEERKPYQLACSYRVRSPRSSREAPIRLSTRITPVVDMQSTADIRVYIAPRGKISSSQVVARIGLPGGCTVLEETLYDLRKARSLSHWEVRDGYIDLYWSDGLKRAVSLTIPVMARVAGNFQTRPSMVYPYYESGKEFYTEPLELKVRNTFGSKLRPEDAIGPGGRPVGRGGRPIGSGG